MSNIYRDATLDQMSEADIGRKIRLAGWVENIRDHGGVSFLDLRDMYAVMQVVLRNGELLRGIRKEQVLSIQGIVEKRDEETYNPKIPTGTIELNAQEIHILGDVYKNLPLRRLLQWLPFHLKLLLPIQYSRFYRILSLSLSGLHN